jgi:hypothetical protein
MRDEPVADEPVPDEPVPDALVVDAPAADAAPDDAPPPALPPPPPGAPTIDHAPAAPPPPPPPVAPAGHLPVGSGPQPGVNPLRELLFADLPAARARSVFAKAGDPGRALVTLADAADRHDPEAARAAMASAPGWNTDTRLHLQAWSLARDAGADAGEDSRDVLGVVVDMGLADGLDTLAGFADGSARYLNHSGSAVVWEVPDMAIGQLVRQLLDAAAIVVAMGGPLDGERLPPPSRGHTMLSVLTRGGIYVGAGPIDAISDDPRGGPVIAAATELLQTLVQRADQANRPR